MKVEVCLTPELIHQHALEGKIAVVVDIFRATSCMVTGMAHNIPAIYPVETVEECTALGEKGLVMAGERGGQKIKHFDIGNSPFDYMDSKWAGREIAVSTTNGTLTIKRSESAEQIVIGAFLNLTATKDYLLNSGKDVLIHCAGWKGTPNMEDTLYAGALLHHLQGPYDCLGDSSLLASALYQVHQKDLLAAAKQSGHAHRLADFGVTRDISFCMEIDKYQTVVGFDGEKLIRI